jgi:hypothetical protein
VQVDGLLGSSVRELDRVVAFAIVAGGVINLGLTQEQLNASQVSSSSIDQRGHAASWTDYTDLFDDSVISQDMAKALCGKESSATTDFAG